MAFLDLLASYSQQYGLPLWGFPSCLRTTSAKSQKIAQALDGLICLLSRDMTVEMRSMPDSKAFRGTLRTVLDGSRSRK